MTCSFRLLTSDEAKRLKEEMFHGTAADKKKCSAGGRREDVEISG